jgi:MoaA/NifB/PqqE/SkfB family radical SAM enzyme
MLPDAINEYQRSIGTGSNHDAFHRLLQFLRQLEKNDEAVEAINSVLKVVPEGDIFLRNVLLNESEIFQGKTFLESKIRSFTITLTNRCNLNCLACEAKKYNWDIPKRITDEISGYLPYLEYIMWQGGEVFLLDYFKDILEEARHYPQLKQLIVTNGTLISDALIKTLINLPDIVLAISIDGTTKDVYEKIRRGARFDKVIGSISDINYARKTNNSNLRLHLNATIMKSNYHQLLDFIEFAKMHGFYSVLFRPVQGNKDNDENIFFRADKDALDFINQNIGEAISRAKKYNIILDNRIPDLSVRGVSDNTKSDASGSLLCYAPWQRMYISWGGNVYPDCMCCWPLDQGVANVDRSPIKDIWNSEGMQLYRKKLIANGYNDICSRDCVSGNVPQRYLLFNR